MATEGHTAIVLLNLGGPDSLEAVRPFLFNLFSDRQIIKLGPPFMQKPLAWMIARRRATKSRKLYELIGGASQLLEITKAQAAALETRMREHGDFRVYVGMRYWKPFIRETLEYAISEGASKIIALSLYPQFSVATSGSSERMFMGDARSLGVKNSAIVPPWYDNPLYLDVLESVLSDALGKAAEGAHVLFSAHSLPKSLIDEGDPYVEHIMATITTLMSRFEKSWSIGYQSRSGPVQWLEPSTESEIARLAASGVKDVVAVPISFVSDHIETLYEIDILYKGLARDAGVRLTRTESLNVHPVFIQALAGLVLTTTRKEGWT